MIPAKDLRIGNIVSNGESIYIVDSNTIYDIEHNDAIFEPVELTHEWLLKFGCVHNEWSGLDLIGRKVTVDEYFIDDGCITLTLNEHMCTKGVHWLQNWYYFETGEELKIK